MSHRKARLTVFYDGECPVCRKEIAFYERVDADRQIVWRDLALLAEEDLPHGKSRAEMLGIFHAGEFNADDQETVWKTGVDAFAAIWSRLPMFRNFAWIFKAPLLRQLAIGCYRLFLNWQRRDRARRKLTTSNRGIMNDASR